MKTLITHIRPHLDDLCAIWLMRRYAPEAKDAAIDFIATNARGGTVADDPDHLYIGVGRGRFDEHKGDVGQCAATLVLAHLKERKLLGDDLPAVEKLAAWVLEEDTGKLNTMPNREFSIPVILQSTFDLNDRDSHKVAALGFSILDGLLGAMRNQVLLDRDWERRVSFLSRFGPAVALESNARDIDSYAYVRGFDIVVFVNTARNYHNVKVKAGAPVDLTPAYEAFHGREPDAAWYLHHSKKMLICGGDLAPGATTSKLTLAEMVELLK